MALTVKQLIKELRKMPQDMEVCFHAHDQNPRIEEEITGWAGRVVLIEEHDRVSIGT